MPPVRHPQDHDDARIPTRLTERLGIEHPVISAPMAFAAGGRLAAAVTAAGGLGLIGGGYGDPDWLETELRAAGNHRVGCGFITWSLARRPALLELVLARDPAAVCLSFADPAPFAPAVRAAGAALICQVQTLVHARRALEVDADVVVAQGSEAGGHGARRATMTLVPEVADEIARTGSDACLCAAGGIADGRGLAASLMLGADGVLVGSRLWATEEACVPEPMLVAALAAGGDDTVRSSVMDVARELDWPPGWTARVLRNGFTDRWHDDLEGLRAAVTTEGPRWTAAWEAGDTSVANTFVGEVAGLIDAIEPAGDVVARIVAEARALLDRRGALRDGALARDALSPASPRRSRRTAARAAAVRRASSRGARSPSLPPCRPLRAARTPSPPRRPRRARGRPRSPSPAPRRRG